jgi:hypothetical protein
MLLLLILGVVWCLLLIVWLSGILLFRRHMADPESRRIVSGELAVWAASVALLGVAGLSYALRSRWYLGVELGPLYRLGPLGAAAFWLAVGVVLASMLRGGHLALFCLPETFEGSPSKVRERLEVLREGRARPSSRRAMWFALCGCLVCTVLFMWMARTPSGSILTRFERRRLLGHELRGAVERGDTEAVASVLQNRNADFVNDRGENRRTALHTAALLDRREAARLLLEHTALPNAKDQAGDAPLHMAVAEGHGEVAAILLDHGARLTAQNDAGTTPLDLAKELERKELLKVLRRHLYAQ